MFSLYTILGLDENASTEEINAAYERLHARLNLENFEPGSLGHTQAQQCLLSIENAFRTLTTPTARQKFAEEWKEAMKIAAEGAIHPKIGQLCVAAGIITLEDLERAVETQTSLNLPLGQILQESRLISQAELDGLLLGQQLITLPQDLPHKVGQRLMALGLVTEDMVRIALIELRTFDKKLEDLLIGHGWLDPSILTILTEAEVSAAE